jgi:endonuclease-3 related protein
VLSPEGILGLAVADLEAAIRSSGYFRAKARKLRELARAYLGFSGRTPSRQELLAVWGIGPETADSIRLYAYGQPEMVIDAYTLRILSGRGWLAAETSYQDAKAFCAVRLPRDVVLYQEFHALLVEHAKRCYRQKPWHDPLLDAVAMGGPPRA